MADETNDHRLLGSVKEWASLIALAVRWGAVVVGGMSLLLYAGEIGHFPSGIGLGEGLAFYLICTAFFLLYFLYWSALTSLGAVLMRWPFEFLTKLDRKQGQAKHKHRYFPPSVPLARMTSLELILTAVIGLWFLVKLCSDGEPQWYWLLLICLGQGLMVGLWLILRRQQEFSEVSLNVTILEDPKRRGERLFALRVVGAMIVILPFLLMPDRQGFVDTTFSWAQLRKERAVIHLKAPWTQLLDQHGLVGAPSFLGPEFKRYEGTTVLLRSLGDSVVIALPSSKTPAAKQKTIAAKVFTGVPQGVRKFAIPASEIWIE